MAVERTGTAVSIATSSSSSSQSVTVPSDCTCAVLFHMGAHDGTDSMFGSGGASFTLGGTSFTWQGRTTANSDYMDAAVLTLINPATGSQTFAWSGCTETSTAPLFALVFYKGVNTSSPVEDVEGISNATSITGLTANSGSMTVGALLAHDTDCDFSGSSQTVILDNITSAKTHADIVEKAYSTGLTGSSSSYPAIIAIVLAASAAATLTQHSFRFFNDDGSESGSTTKAALNTNINLSANDVARIRFLIDATGDPSSKLFQLEYRKKPSGGSFGPWTEVT